MAHHVRARRVTEPALADGRGHALQQAPPELRRRCLGLGLGARDLGRRRPHGRHATLLTPRAGPSWYSDVPSIWYVRVPSTGGAYEHRDTAGWPITPALRAGRRRDRRSAVDDAPTARALRFRLQDQ